MKNKNLSKHKLKSKRQNKGMTFIEVLVALVILVTGILGAVALQATAKKASFDAMQRSLASGLAQDIFEKMRSNGANQLPNIPPLNLYTGNYGNNNVAIPPVCNQNNFCTAAQMAGNDLFSWEQAIMGADVTNGLNNTGGLVDGAGCILQNGNQVTVAISWQGKSETTDSAAIAGCGTANNKRRQIVMVGFIY